MRKLSLIDRMKIARERKNRSYLFNEENSPVDCAGTRRDWVIESAPAQKNWRNLNRGVCSKNLLLKIPYELI